MGNAPKKSSYTQTLHLKPFAAGFSRKNWKGNLLTESRLCFENRIAELSLSNLGSRSQFSAGGTSGSCPVRDAGITEWQHSRGRQCSDMTCYQWPFQLRVLPSPSLPCLGVWVDVLGPNPRSVPAQDSAGRNARVKATWPWQQRSPACSTMSPRPGKERWHQGKWCHRQRSRKTAVTWGQDCQFYLFPASCHAQVMKWRGRRDIKEICIMLPPCPKDTKSNL